MLSRRGRSISTARAAVRLGLITGCSGLVLGLLTTAVALSMDSTTPAIVLRSSLVTALLVLTTRGVAAERRAAGDGGGVFAAVLGGLALGYALDLCWWGGHAYVAQLLVDHAALRVVLDGVLWVLVGSLAARRSIAHGGVSGG